MDELFLHELDGSPCVYFEKELWLPYPKAPCYLVSNLGNIYSTISGKMLSQSPRREHAYLAVRIKLPSKGSLTEYVHRIVAETFVHNPDPENRTIVCHKNDICRDNRASNLYWGTLSDNMYDAWSNGGKRYGSKWI